MNNSFLQIQNLTRQFPIRGQDEPLTVFENANFSIEQGEFVCITGHSGCGKSTILNALAGLDTPTRGAVIMDGKEVTGPSLEQGIVFQNYSLLPWMTVFENVHFGVRARWPNWSKEQIADQCMKFIKLVGLSGTEQRKPSELSGGMRQRVSIARAFATQPKLLLLDEPFGALDALTRGNIQEELIKIWTETKQTIFMITHDVDEAILLADRVLLMSNGPRARIAESVEVDIVRPRDRASIIEDPAYYKIRNYLVNFLVNRSGELSGLSPELNEKPIVVNPARDIAAEKQTKEDSASTSAAKLATA